MSRHADPDRDKQIVQLYRAGRTGSEIGRIVGMAQSGVIAALKRLGVPRRRGMARLDPDSIKSMCDKASRSQHGKPARADEYRRDLAAGLTVKEVALKYGVSRQAVYQARRRKGDK